MGLSEWELPYINLHTNMIVQEEWICHCMYKLHHCHSVDGTSQLWFLLWTCEVLDMWIFKIITYHTLLCTLQFYYALWSEDLNASKRWHTIWFNGVWTILKITGNSCKNRPRGWSEVPLITWSSREDLLKIVVLLHGLLLTSTLRTRDVLKATLDMNYPSTCSIHC